MDETDEGGILIDIASNVYLVKGIVSDWEELLSGSILPVLVETTIMPYKNCIITTGLMEKYEAKFTVKQISEFEEIYHNAEKKKRIIRRM